MMTIICDDSDASDDEVEVLDQVEDKDELEQGFIFRAHDPNAISACRHDVLVPLKVPFFQGVHRIALHSILVKHLGGIGFSYDLHDNMFCLNGKRFRFVVCLLSNPNLFRQRFSRFL